MPRKPRLHYRGALYHVITRGNNRQKIFNSEENYRTFLKTLKELKEKKPFCLYAYCLMPNHLHLLIEVDKEPLSVIMQRLLTGYTKYHNYRNKSWGHLFQGRYKAILCEKDSYLLELSRYIHLNPVRAKMVKKPAEWEWSGHGEYIGKGVKGLIDEDTVLRCFSENKSRARIEYEEFVRDGVNMGHRADIYPAEKVPYLGKEEYIEKQIRMHEDAIGQMTPGIIRDRKGMKEILKEVCSDAGIKTKEVQGNSRKSKISTIRKAFIFEAYEAGHRGADIARFVGRTQSFVTKLIDGKIGNII